MTEYKKRIWLYLFMFLMSSLALEAKNLPFYNGGFEIWESYLLTNFNEYTDMPSGWDLTTNSYPVDLRKEDNYHTNPYPPRQGQYALYYFDTSFNRPIKTKGYTLSEGTYTYSVYASTMGWTNTYITLTVEGDITTSKKMAVNGSWSKYSITFTLEETATVYFGIDNKKTYDGNGTISHFIVDDCSLQTTDGNLISTQYDYTSNENANFAYYLYSSGEAELVKCNNKDISGKIEIPSTVTKDGTTYKIRTISCNAFENCSNISEIVLPAYLYEIGTEAFKNCSSLKTLVVSNRVTSISANAFAECNRLEDIELFAKERVKFESNSFPANSNLCLYVPNVDDYNSLTTFSVKSLAYVNSLVEYNGRNPILTYTFAPGVSATDIDLNDLSPNVGTYNLPATFTHTSGLKVNGYITFNIEKKALNVKADDIERIYGNNNPPLKITYSGFVNNEDESVLTAKPTVGTTATKTSNVGEYPITVSGGSAKNYIFGYEPGTLTITKAPLTAKVNDVTRQYGQDNPAFTISYTGLKNGETVPAWTTAPTFQTEATKASGVGEYAIKAINGVPVNYDIEIADGTLSITPASLTIKANDATRLYYSDDPAFSYKCNGFVNGDDESVLISTPTLSTSATRESKVGTYEIKVGETSCSNYSISYVNGTLTITPCTLVASVGNYERKYNEENPVFEVKYDGFVGNEDESSLLTKPQATTTATKTSDVGTYPITLAGGSADNYSFSYTSGVLTVNKAEQTIEWDQNLIGVRKGEQIKLTAKTLSGLPISYTSENSSIAEVYSSGNDFYLDCKAEGETQILALQAGNKNYFASQKIRKTVSVTINKYKLIYMVDGELYKTVTYELGATITPEPAPTKEGYTFSGWSGVPEIMPDYDVTVTGSFSPNQYTITYMIDGKQYSKETVDFGSKIEPPTPPNKEGYHFVWQEYPEIMPAYDITINGSYIENITLTITSKGKGILTYNGDTIQGGTSIFTVEEGSSAIINFTPNPGYIIKSVKLNSDDITILLSNGQYTISNIRENQIVEAEFIGDIINMADADVNYSVISYEEQTVMVTAGNYGNVLTVPASFTAKEKTWTVVGIDEDALKDNTTLAAIIWNPEVAFTAKVNNRNLLLYVKDAQYAPATIQNVVVNNQAENIVLVEAASGNDFYCPQAFTAKRISYEHNYSMISGYKTCQGWETLVLPFDVTMMINAKGQELTPYINWQYGNSQRPFWLYEMTTQGWKAGSAIKANTPYIISMPNNEMYDVSFNQTGNIQFIGTNVEVKASTDMKTGQHGNKRLVANYQTQAASSDIYALNVSNDWHQNTATEKEGSTFIRSLRSVHPFEAYLTVEGSNAPWAIPVFENGVLTDIVEMERMRNGENEEWYDLQGRKLQGEPKKNGIYLHNGKKVRK